MLLALSGGQKLGILIVAGLFIGFALASSFLFPRSRPDFPGTRGLKLFVALSLVLLVSMLTAIAVLAREPEEEGGHEQPAGETTAGEAAPAGDAEAGKAVFSSAGCGGCHTLQDAGTRGEVGPNLDDAQPDHALVIERVTNGQGVMPSFAGELSDAQIQDVAAYVVEATGAS